MTDLVESIKSGNIFEFQKSFSALIKSKYQKLNEDTEPEDVESTAVNAISAALRTFACSNDFDYSSGVLSVSFTCKNAVYDAINWCEESDLVDNFEVLVTTSATNSPYTKDVDVDFDSITNDSGFTFVLLVYLDENLISYEVEYDEETGEIYDEAVDVAATTAELKKNADFETMSESAQLDEIKRVVKVNAAGKRTVKMKCNPGFKFNPTARTCEKISGKDLANSRISHRHAVLTKRSEGSSFKVRVNRRTKKAMRFRKAQGL
jgi:hypothetical protein